MIIFSKFVISLANFSRLFLSAKFRLSISLVLSFVFHLMVIFSIFLFFYNSLDHKYPTGSGYTLIARIAQVEPEVVSVSNPTDGGKSPQTAVLTTNKRVVMAAITHLEGSAQQNGPALSKTNIQMETTPISVDSSLETLGPISNAANFEIDTHSLAPNGKMPVGPFGSSTPNASWGKLNAPVGAASKTSGIPEAVTVQELQKQQRKNAFLESIRQRNFRIIQNRLDMVCLAFINLEATQGSVTCLPPEAVPAEIAALNGAVLMTGSKPSNALCFPYGQVSPLLTCQ